MEHYTSKKKLKHVLFGLTGVALACSSAIAVAGNSKGNQGPAVSGNCAALSADRATEFHGNPNESDLSLAMAGNQWVVFNNVMSRFNERRIANGEYKVTDDDLLRTGSQTLEFLRTHGRKYFIELIPPGKERAQILSGCMTLGNEKDTNFLPFSIQTNFDIFASTNYTEMQTLAAKGFVAEALPYTKNQLTIMVSLASGLKGMLEGPSELDTIYNTVMFMLDSANKVANVDHKDEGVHAGINKMYKFMDKYIRENGSPAQITALNNALFDLNIPQAGSPSLTRADDIAGHTHATDHILTKNADCNYGDGIDGNSDGDFDDIGDKFPTLRFCEFAVLNKGNTHETRVHHVEIPGGILGKPNFVEVVAGPVWVSELQFAKDAGDLVEGIDIPVVSLNNGDKVNGPVVYSIAFLATMDEDHRALAEDFMAFIREEGGAAQNEYTLGGFNAMTAADLAGGQIYDCDGNGIADEVVNGLAVPQTCP